MSLSEDGNEIVTRHRRGHKSEAPSFRHVLVQSLSWSITQGPGKVVESLLRKTI